VVAELYCSDGLTHVPICHEQEGIGICAGAYLGGWKAAMVMPNAGLLNCCNALTTLNLLNHLPVLLLVSFRGDFGEEAFFHAPLGRTTEPVLKALEIPYRNVRRSDELAEAVKAAEQLAHSSSRPVALLLGPGALENRREEAEGA
jgi:sulfopyruvate decarboxylase subunit alpha